MGASDPKLIQAVGQKWKQQQKEKKKQKKNLKTAENDDNEGEEKIIYNTS